LAKQSKINPNEALNNTSSQKTYEIVFNYGLALFKSEKYLEAFKCFEKVSLGTLKQNPKLWYYMGICALFINKKQFERDSQAESEVFHSKLGYKNGAFDREASGSQMKRFVLE